MKKTTRSGKALMDSACTFSEARFLSFFGGLDRERLYEILKSWNPLDWGQRGEPTPTAFTAPLDTLAFPRAELGRLGWAFAGVANTLEPIQDKLIECYCAAMHVYCEAHTVTTGYEALPNSCALLFRALERMDYQMRFHAALFLYWVYGLVEAPEDRDDDPRPVLSAYAVLLLGSCLADLAEACKHDMLAALEPSGSPLTPSPGTRQFDVWFLDALALIAGADGRVARAFGEILEIATRPR